MDSAWSWQEIWQSTVWPLLVMAFQSVVLLVALLVIIAFLLLMDRKVWAAVQLRRGPNVVGPFGLLQSFADLLKFVLKEPLIPAGADKGVFLLAPLVASVLALAAWGEIPLPRGLALRGSNGVLRSLDRLRDHYRAAGGGLAQLDRDRQRAARGAWH